MSSSQKGPPSSPSTASFSASKPFKDNFWHRYLTLGAIQILKRIRPREGNVLMLTDGICVKYGRRVHLSEASTMRFISQHTSIPVPKVLCAFTRSGWTYIVMERIRGDIIGEGWVNRSEDSKAKLLSQLAEKIREMRELQPSEGNTVSSVDGGSLFDCRIPGPSLRFGPFDSIQNFHRHLRMGMDFDSRVDLEIQELIKQQSKTWPLVFTHGDLSSLNILARRDDIVGIIDWETAGWYPSYWEYTSAYQVNPQNSFWVNEIDKFLQPMSKELAMEQIRQKYFGDV
ncbi:Aminoglycoside phosphotransferase [Penicillium cf. griseofulvum]|uniref:Aminoglycoside phosphotransferase n=1 Tax=Penicillium cf. griseofulvum TaxID=2972120 RepID=A0A9W9M753_9EURO|nr:Aminoglycoside phosphotransferase [Penicillium cf. griseofulvum]KAJ5432050.1 Aminoglycoside phosphotransferase [Penicillium cf. griseofulvum]